MKLIVNGDDYGISKAVNYAMIDCHMFGVMKSCSMMVNMDGARHGAAMAQLYPTLSIGIHFNLTVGEPLIKTHKTLVKEDGTFNKAILKDSSKVDEEEIRVELEAQMQKFNELMGRNPTHINSHHGICVIKGAQKIVCDLARHYDLPVRRFFSVPQGNLEELPFAFSQMKFDQIKFDALSTPSSMIDTYTSADLKSDKIFEYALHPGYVDYSLSKCTSLTQGRYHDANVFMSDEVRAWIKDNAIELVDYSALPRQVLNK